MEIIIPKTTVIKLTPEMELWKGKFPPWREGGPKWEHLTCAGIFRWNQARKFNEMNELFENIKEHFSVT